MSPQPSHADILTELQAMRAEMEPLVEMAPTLKELVEFRRALDVGGKSVRWMGAIAAALVAIGGLALGVMALIERIRG